MLIYCLVRCQSDFSMEIFFFLRMFDAIGIISFVMFIRE